MAAALPVRYKFGDYELDVSLSALYGKRERIPLQSKPMALLAVLLARRGQVVTRDELARELWPDTHVLVDQGLNAAIRKLRVALKDDARAPKYIETLGSRGYRVIPEVIVTRWAEGVTAATRGTRIAALPLKQVNDTPEETPATEFVVYEQYLRGLHFVNMRTAEGFRKGIEYFERAIKQDPNYPNPLGALADAYNAMAVHGLIVPREGYRRARAYASRALQLSPNLLEAIAPLAYAELADGYEFDKAARALQRAIRLNPGCAPAHKMQALLHLANGDVNSALKSGLRALELDPLSLATGSICSMLYMYARRYDEAIEQGLKSLELGADFPVGHAALGWAYTVSGRHEEALRCYEAALRYSNRASPMHAHLAFGLACAGRHREACEQMRRATEAGGGVTPSYALALASFEVGETEQAARFLRAAFDEREGWLMFLDTDPRADRLRTLPEAQKIAEAIAARRPGHIADRTIGQETAR